MVLSAGVPYFRVERRGFAKLRKDPDALVVFTAGMAQKVALIDSAPEKFFSTDHYSDQPAVLVRLETVADDELVGLLTTSWRLRASEDLRGALDADAGALSGKARS